MKKGLRPPLRVVCDDVDAGIVDLMKKGLRRFHSCCVRGRSWAGIVDLMKKGLRLKEFQVWFFRKAGIVDLMKKGLRPLAARITGIP